jgi:hypothetical protein
LLSAVCCLLFPSCIVCKSFTPSPQNHVISVQGILTDASAASVACSLLILSMIG